MARITNEVKLERNLKFGIEIEFNNDVRRELAESLRNKGISVVIEGYNHDVSRAWKITTDVSCGFEIVSPILYNFEELQKVCDSLNEVGAKVDVRCGLHVHHDADGFGLENVKNVYRLYNKYIKSIDSMMPKSRREDNSTWCKNNFPLEQIESHEDMRTLTTFLTDNEKRSRKRYKKINFCSYLAYGTIEFRQHSGTTEFDKMFNWIMITHLLMQRALGKKVKPTTEKRLVKWNESDLHMMYDFYIELGISGTDIANYVRERRKKLSGVA